MIHRADLHGALFDAVRVLKPDAIHFNSRCIGFEQDDLSVEIHFDDSQSQRGDVLIGADGVHSEIRDQLVGVDRPHFTGCVAWRGLVPAERLPAKFLRPVGVNWIGRGGHIVTYPIRQRKMLNFVGIVERSNWHVESWTEKGTHEECEADFNAWHAEIHEIIHNIETPYKWALLEREPLARWSFGRVTLLGDNVKRFHNPILADAVGAQHYVDTEWREDKVTQRYDWIFEYDARTAGSISSVSEASVVNDGVCSKN